jgi:glycosyltransferase involved in cell wall biosynthesis
MANCLASKGIESDVFDCGGIHRGIGRTSVLPEPGSSIPRFNLDSVGDYDAILQVGPWQNPLEIKRVLARKKKDQPLYYLPRGGLALIEFVWPRGIKKHIYLRAIERRFIDASSGVIYSSNAERSATIRAASGRRPEYVIPDFVAPSMEEFESESYPLKKVTTFAFLAEISPRKGLLTLTKAFVEWCEENSLQDRVQLVIGGAPRPGCERYFEEVQALLKSDAGRNVELIGTLPHSERSGFYRDVDIMVVSSRFESFGLTVIEALTAGCSLLVAPGVGALEYVPDSELLTVAQGDDVASIKGGLSESFSLLVSHDHVLRKQNAEFGNSVVGDINEHALHEWAHLITAR